jgi:mannose-6-phosphate isomerase
MKLTRLVPRAVNKIWGRQGFPAPFEAAGDENGPVGEIWFEPPNGSEPALLLKYLFTSETSSIQVHPADPIARAAGHTGGKDEAWMIVDAEPGAVIGLGLRKAVAPDRLREAALDGTIADMIDWRRAAAGDVYYLPAGTVHALGPGLVLIEVQQNSDLTYRLYDYGRPRPLHVEDGIKAVNPLATVAREEIRSHRQGREMLSQRERFVLERWSGMKSAQVDPGDHGPVWLIPLQGKTVVGGQALEPGCAWMIDESAALSQDAGSQLMAAYAGSVRPGLLGG